MNPTYQFTLEQLTIGDALSLAAYAGQNKVLEFLTIADRYTVGGTLALPYAELRNISEQFAQAFVAHVQQMSEPEMPDALRLLKQALGGGDSHAQS